MFQIVVSVCSNNDQSKQVRGEGGGAECDFVTGPLKEILFPKLVLGS